MAERAIKECAFDPIGEEAKKCHTLFAGKKYPELFSIAQRNIGREKLLSIIESSMKTARFQGRIYEYIAAWPFACYLTTNFDDALPRYLEGIGCTSLVRRNSKDDMRVLHSNSRDIVFKIHGDTTVPNDMVFTAEQYAEFRTSASRAYWRNSLLAALKMVDIVMIGYSASDPDFQDQLIRAKDIFSPARPIFMFAADFTTEQIREFYKYNIRVISYSNDDGNHGELKRLLKRYDRFIGKRSRLHTGVETINESADQETASAIYLFTHLRLDRTNDTCIERTYSAIILRILSRTEEGHSMGVAELQDKLARKTFATSNVDPVAMTKALERLYDQGLITYDPGDKDLLVVSPNGREMMRKIEAEGVVRREKFEKSCFLYLKKEHPGLDNKATELIVSTLDKGLVRAYEKRGIEIANSLFQDVRFDISDATDILDTINRMSALLENDEQRGAFFDLMMEVMLNPDEEMREHLGALSQGYFAYHGLGLDPKCSQDRLTAARQKKWIFDSSILLPALACNCSNYRYAKDLLDRMQVLKFDCQTTEKLFEEVRQHAGWAIANVRGMARDDLRLLQMAIAGPGYKQNLFVDGFLRWSQSQGAPSFDQYMSECLGSDYTSDLASCIRKRIEERGIAVFEFSQWNGFSEELLPERDKIAREIEEVRKGYGTYRNESQCNAEAEVILMSRKQDVGFLSQSSVLNRVQSTGKRLTWRPEEIYRFLSFFSSAPAEADLLYDCMLQEFYSCGIDIVDKKVIREYADPAIRQARMQVKQELEKYKNAVGGKELAEMERAFDQAPDEQKPFYSMQFAFYVADAERKKREAAEAQAEQYRKTRQLSDEERRELNKLKAEKQERKRRAEKKSQKSGKKRKKKRNRRKKNR